MNTFINDFAVGIDVASKSSVITILMPGGKPYGKSFSITNDLKGFTQLLTTLQEIQKKFSKDPRIFMESTGLYHLCLYNYFTKNNYECYIINPIQTKNFAKQSIRKVKNDKVDSLRIAQLAHSPMFSTKSTSNEDTFLLKKLCREYDSLISDTAQYKTKISSLLSLVFPKFNDVFSNSFSSIPLAILSKYPTYIDFLSASKSNVIALITSTVNHSKEWADKKYTQLLTIAKEAEALKLNTDCLGIEMSCYINIIKTMINSIEILKKKIIDFYVTIPNFKENVRILCTHPELGEISAVCLLAEIGDVNNFKNAKKLVAFLGMDTSISQSGDYTRSHNRLTKRGSKLARKILYQLALNSTRTLRNGAAANAVLLDLYKKLIQRKPKKVALCILMHKILNHLFAILRD